MKRTRTARRTARPDAARVSPRRAQGRAAAAALKAGQEFWERLLPPDTWNPKEREALKALKRAVQGREVTLAEARKVWQRADRLRHALVTLEINGWLRKSRDGVSEGAYYARVLRGKGQRLRVYELDARRFAEARIEFREWLEDVDGSGWVELWDVDPCRHGDACKALERITVGGAS